MPTISKRPNGYQVKVRLAGQPVQSATFDTKAKAAAWGHALEAKMRDQRHGIVKATLQDVIDKYISDVCPTLRSGANMAKRLKALAKKLDIHDLARMIGHRDLKSLLIYYRKTASDMAKSLD